MLLRTTLSATKSKKDYITQKEKSHRRTMLLEGEAILFGAANEVRTRDVLLGKQVLYQLSYSRIKNIYNLILEQRVRFELTVLRICNPLHWASLPPLHLINEFV